jgi:16S rRNA (uracil1498-N3)-methyltransferase
MPAFFVEPGDVDGEHLILVDEEAHHTRVRRCREGDVIDVINGEGSGYLARIASMAPKRVTAQIIEHRPEWGESPVSLHLAAAVPKGARFDLVIEKGTEVGVSVIVPLLTARGVIRPEAGGRRDERWRRLARAAAKQCGRSRVPRIAEPMTPGVAADELARACPHVLAAVATAGLPLPSGMASAGPAALFVGPEGGFAPEEWASLLEHGARPFTWGERTLRAETAAIVLSALVLDAASQTVQT